MNGYYIQTIFVLLVTNCLLPRKSVKFLQKSRSVCRCAYVTIKGFKDVLMNIFIRHVLAVLTYFIMSAIIYQV